MTKRRLKSVGIMLIVIPIVLAVLVGFVSGMNQYPVENMHGSQAISQQFTTALGFGVAKSVVMLVLSAASFAGCVMTAIGKGYPWPLGFIGWFVIFFPDKEDLFDKWKKEESGVIVDRLKGTAHPIRTACIVLGIPIAFSALTYIATPGYLSPLLKNSTGLVILGVASAWGVLGYFLMLRASLVSSEGNWVQIVSWILVVMLFILPCCMVPMLGPAVLTILNALSPIMSTGAK